MRTPSLVLSVRTALIACNRPAAVADATGVAETVAQVRAPAVGARALQQSTRPRHTPQSGLTLQHAQLAARPQHPRKPGGDGGSESGEGGGGLKERDRGGLWQGGG
eukprot:scaffold106078_cov18-Tisochrysis_lutea.AAC.3